MIPLYSPIRVRQQYNCNHKVILRAFSVDNVRSKRYNYDSSKYLLNGKDQHNEPN